MKLAIHMSGIAMSPNLIGYIERRADFSLSRLGLYVQRIKVRLVDLNGPRGGVDKRCQVQIQLVDEAPLIVTETSADEFSAISQAFSVVGRLASSRIAQRVTRARKRDATCRQVPQIVG